MIEQPSILIASSDLEDRKSMLHILDKLSLNVISCSALSQAREVLYRQDVSLVFCDELLVDGSYRDLLQMLRAIRPAVRVVVMIHRGEWDEYLDAVRLGAFDAVRCPLRPTDVELTVLRAMRDGREATIPHRMIA